METKKLFILGVGAQKSGTSWLHNQLVKNGCIDMGFTKEYHVFDTVFCEYCKTIKTHVIDTVIEKHSQAKLGTNDASYPNISKRLSFIDNTENYFDYFDYLYLKNSETLAVGDITPSYAMLGKEAFRHIKNGLESRGFEVKVIFLMRDPVERVWSMLRMGRRNFLKQGRRLKFSEMEDLRRVYKTADCVLRTRYDWTSQELEKVFSSNNIFHGLYERLFTEDGYNMIQSFLGIPLEKPAFDFHTNISPKNEQMDLDLAKEIASYYAEVYKYASGQSAGQSEELWSGYKYLS
jgi:hypothetical protein